MLDFLHDATLKNVEFDWPNGIVRITLKTGVSASNISTLVAHGVRGLQCPHLAPWGLSNSVNAASIETLADGCQRVVIEMQSGDVIEVACGNVTVDRKIS